MMTSLASQETQVRGYQENNNSLDKACIFCALITITKQEFTKVIDALIKTVEQVFLIVISEQQA